MKFYTRVDTPKRLEKFKNIAIKFNLYWITGTSPNRMPSINSYEKPLSIMVDTSINKLGYASVDYFKSRDKYVHIKLSQLEMVLEELL